MKKRFSELLALSFVVGIVFVVAILSTHLNMDVQILTLLITTQRPHMQMARVWEIANTILATPP